MSIVPKDGLSRYPLGLRPDHDRANVDTHHLEARYNHWMSEKLYALWAELAGEERRGVLPIHSRHLNYLLAMFREEGAPR